MDLSNTQPYLQPEILAALIGAFAGAFFAFLFFVLGNLVKKIGERTSMHYNTVVKVEKMLLENYEISNSILFVIEDLRNTIDQSKRQRRFMVNYNILEQFVIDTYFLSNLIGIKLTNQLEELFIIMRRVNNSIRTLNEANKRIVDKIHENNLIKDNDIKSMLLDEYLDNITILDKGIDSLYKMVEIEVRPEIKSVSAYVGALLEKKPFSKVMFEKFFARKYINIEETVVEQKLHRLETELEQNEKQHRERLKKIYGQSDD